jgi:hypothetical protein
VGGIRKSVRREDSSRQNRLRQRFSFDRHLKTRQTADDRKPLLHFRGIASGGLVDHDLGDRALEHASSIRLPLLRGLLVSRDNHVSAGPSDQVADDGGFQVHRFHDLHQGAGCQADSIAAGSILI